MIDIRGGAGDVARALRTLLENEEEAALALAVIGKFREILADGDHGQNGNIWIDIRKGRPFVSGGSRIDVNAGLRD